MYDWTTDIIKSSHAASFHIFRQKQWLISVYFFHLDQKFYQSKFGCSVGNRLTWLPLIFRQQKYRNFGQFRLIRLYVQCTHSLWWMSYRILGKDETTWKISCIIEKNNALCSKKNRLRAASLLKAKSCKRLKWQRISVFSFV